MLQSTPQPVVGFDRGCHTAVDEPGELIAGDYSPVRDSIALAVECMAEPDPSYLTASNADIECALYDTPQGCRIDGRCGGAEPCLPEDLFPPPTSYRAVPRVLRAGDYVVDGEVDVAQLQSDFACASLVGTRGYGLERGLEAMKLAVSPSLADGANQGFIRDDSAFAVMFVTDEDDCSHDGTLREDNAGGGDVCAFANDGTTDGPLIPVTTMKERLIANLSATKGRAVGEEEVFVGSIHGTPLRFAGPVPTESECGAEPYEGITPACATSLGIAYSGDRYNRLIRQFPDGNFFPGDQGPAAWICQGDFSPALGALGAWLADGVSR